MTGHRLGVGRDLSHFYYHETFRILRLLFSSYFSLRVAVFGASLSLAVSMMVKLFPRVGGMIFGEWVRTPQITTTKNTAQSARKVRSEPALKPERNSNTNQTRSKGLPQTQWRPAAMANACGRRAAHLLSAVLLRSFLSMDAAVEFDRVAGRDGVAALRPGFCIATGRHESQFRS
eukprot:SAG11_NODE_96_length_17016_cov_18.755113_5_plen_175_part_00